VAIEIRATAPDEVAKALTPIWHYFGGRPEAEEIERLGTILPPERVLAALDGGEIVGGAGAYLFETTVPGGAQVPTAGVMAVGVLPTHRRRGALTALMRRQLADAHERGEPIAMLFAAEGGIYGRFGYGLASLAGDIELPKEHARPWDDEPLGSARLLDTDDEVLDVVPGIYDRVQAETTGMFTRTRDWWQVRRLSQRPGSRGRRMNVVIELDGVPEAYALYRIDFGMSHMVTESVVEVSEAVGTSPRALAAIWRYLLAIDWVSGINAYWLPLDHPLFHWIREPRRMRFSVLEALWVRPVDVGAALAARGLREGEVVLDVRDELCPWNQARWRVANGSAERTTAPADLQLDVSALGSAYLGGFGFEQLRWAGRLEELKPGAVERADELFRTERQPWSPELF
jgi:predicted acetyltransferase